MNHQTLDWTPHSWRDPSRSLVQSPDWGDDVKLHKVVNELKTLPPLVFAGEMEQLKREITKASRGQAFILQGGDCSENFKECTSVTIRETFKVLLQMAIILTYASKKPVVKIGRIAGQFAKPRSSGSETIDGVTLPSYRGDMVNRQDFTKEGRIPDPENLRMGYFHSSATLNLLRAFSQGGFSSLGNIHKWNKHFVENTPQGKNFEQLASNIDQALQFMETIGFDMETHRELKTVDFYTSHEALLLEYEYAMTRQDSLSGRWYGCSAHFLWVGERTRQADSAHLEYLRGICNPVGMKVGPKYDLDNICRTAELLNPKNEPGKLVLITRHGSDKVSETLPPLMRRIKQEGFEVAWICDPMHGNTFSTQDGIKSRDFDTILKEIKVFFDVCHAEGTIPGGIHAELTGLDVTECVGGMERIDHQALSRNYQTSCDPRLNAIQSIELAFKIAEMLQQ